MVVVTKVNRQAYIRKKDNPFKSFAYSVVSKGKDNPDYSALSAQILDVETKNQLYDDSLSLAETYGGIDRTDMKDKRRKEVVKSLNALVDELEELAETKPDPGAFIEFLGFELAKVPGRKTGVVAPPHIQSLKSGGDDARRGVVKCVLKAADPLEIKAIKGRRSEDNGQTWVEDIVAAKLIFEMTGQPSGLYVLYQFMFIATNNRKSDWCVQAGVSVA